MFETGEYVVYGRTGICQVTGVTTMRVDGSSGDANSARTVRLF